MKERILAIGAHPDDIEIGCGGTLAKLNQNGFETFHLIVTSGEEGSLSISKESLARTREEEAISSAKVLKSSQVFFLREPDGLTDYSKELRIKMISMIRELRPDMIFTHAQSDAFPDHHVIHRLTLDAVLAAAGPWYPEAGGHLHSVTSVYGYEVWHPMPSYQIASDISRFMEIKTHALQMHTTQIQNVNYVQAIEGLSKYRGVMSMAGEYAEVFEVIKTGAF